ncbi:DEAD/DEAH box helicase family protein [Tenacibaculum finnmarkense]|uniref:helicase-related protein n=1 Tax=Tenacibaculum finnmarkense TaxID=2781243 RepID=UPI001EFA2D17|nr:helicase-related protein [Tenacibaculum finnmarkense]MCG8761955.1 DEAD/DEAH box helicase family protein [Tenacibaculum finnmarkense]MCG8787330.1 DEAD/DEAH box helicase family protein [Tenacibaculum finnmarkense]
MKIINNKDTLLMDELKSLINENSKVYLSCNYFTSFAFFELIDILKKSIQVNILLDLNEDKKFEFIQNEEEEKLNLKLDRKYKINQVIGLIEDKIKFRKGITGNQNILIVENKDITTCFTLTPLNLDSISLGSLSSRFPIFINSFEDVGEQYLNLFNNSWENSNQLLNDNILELLNKGTTNFSGEDIYKYCIREIFNYSTVNERAAEKLEKVGFKDSKIWRLLYNFQKDAVIGAIEKIEAYGGCIIADSVGLGKTFEALGVIKYYQLRNSRILVLAPKKLRENWTIYTLNDKRNILAEDRLNYNVLNHTDLSRVRGKSGDIDLETISWGNYDLVVIDESHNFRNNPTKKGVTRYKRLMQDVIKANIRTKVLMLSATPVNNKMNDLKNQIAFITEGDDAAFTSYGIDSVTQVMRDSQRRFTNWFRDGDPDNLDVNELMQHLDGAYFRILDMLTIARSRKHIEKYYDTTDIGKFPNRLAPITIHPEIDTKNQFKDIGQIYDEISTLTLASYTPLGYVMPHKRDFYEEKYDMQTHTGSVFKQVDREQSLIYLMRVNLLKRLESSIHSFKLTIERLINLVNSNLKQLEEHKNGDIDLDTNITDIDIDDTTLEDLLIGGKTKVLIQDIDGIRWKQDLKHDKKILTSLLSNIKLIDVERDAKLLKLRSLIEDKLENPLNGNNKKVIVFTAFADTANYMYSELSEWLKKEKGLNTALVTGSGHNKTNMKDCRNDLNSILTHFSPLSKKRKDVYPDATSEIDILFCTDCISEGQNLQDCDYLVNYDIHWNPVRIIQRFGRIDRIGSINKQIQLVNFFPSMELDSFIDLVAKVKGRMVMLDVSATGEDNVISRNSREMQDLDYRKRQLKQLQDQVIDLEDIDGNISITDMTFNDFKIDLEKSSDAQIEALNEIPPASYAIVKSNLSNVKEGVIFCLKDTNNDISDKLKNNILYPYFLVYTSLDGENTVTASQTKIALDYFRKLCMGNDKVLPDLVAEFEKETKGTKKMEAYTKRLKISLKNVVGIQEEVGLDMLATRGTINLLNKGLGNDDDLELISYLIIK